LKPTAETIRNVSKSPGITYQYVNSVFQKQYGIQWLKPLGFNNAYALMMRRKQAEELHIKSISDLAHYFDGN
ncbi:glycine betaine ABC transporter substrate-binding protein, partial [Chryseobacterium sp.]